MVTIYGQVPGVFLAFSLLPGIRRARYQESQVSLAVTLWLLGVAVDRTFNSEYVDVCARLFVNHRVCFYLHVKFSTAKFFFSYGTMLSPK